MPGGAGRGEVASARRGGGQAVESREALAYCGTGLAWQHRRFAEKKLSPRREARASDRRTQRAAESPPPLPTHRHHHHHHHHAPARWKAASVRRRHPPRRPRRRPPSRRAPIVQRGTGPGAVTRGSARPLPAAPHPCVLRVWRWRWAAVRCPGPRLAVRGASCTGGAACTTHVAGRCGGTRASTRERAPVIPPLAAPPPPLPTTHTHAHGLVPAKHSPHMLVVGRQAWPCAHHKASLYTPPSPCSSAGLAQVWCSSTTSCTG